MPFLKTHWAPPQDFYLTGDGPEGETAQYVIIIIKLYKTHPIK